MLRDFTLPFGTLLALCLSWRIGHSSYRRLIYQAALTSRTDTGVAIVELVRPLERDLGAVQTQFQESGYTILRDVLPPSLTASLLAEAQLIFRERQGADRLPRVPVNAMYSAWLESSTLRRFWSTSNISAGLAHVFTSATLRLLDDVVIVTEPSKMAYGCWHSDWYSFGSVAKETHHSAYYVVLRLDPIGGRASADPGWVNTALRPQRRAAELHRCGLRRRGTGCWSGWPWRELVREAHEPAL